MAVLMAAVALLQSAWAAPGSDGRFEQNLQQLDTSLLDADAQAMLAQYREDRRRINARNWRRAALPGPGAVDCPWDDSYKAWAGIETPADVIFTRALVTNRGRGSVDLGFADFTLRADGACPAEIGDGPATFWIEWQQLSSAMEPAAVSDLAEARALYEATAVDSRMKVMFKLEGELRDGQPHGRFLVTQINHMPEAPGIRNPGEVSSKAMGYADFEAGRRLRFMTVGEMPGDSTLVTVMQPHGESHQFVYWMMSGRWVQPLGDWYTTNADGELDGWFVRYRSDENPARARVCVQGNLPAPASACEEA